MCTTLVFHTVILNQLIETCVTLGEFKTVLSVVTRATCTTLIAIYNFRLEPYWRPTLFVTSFMAYVVLSGNAFVKLRRLCLLRCVELLSQRKICRAIISE